MTSSEKKGKLKIRQIYKFPDTPGYQGLCVFISEDGDVFELKDLSLSDKKEKRYIALAKIDVVDIDQ